MIGDSFVEAREVPIDDKFHVRLEELAADELPHLNITTSAFGIEATGQVHQLPFYDEYARLLCPKLLVLVFVRNDFRENLSVPEALTLRELTLPNPPNFFQRSWFLFVLHKKLKGLFSDMDKENEGIHEMQYTSFAIEQFKQRADRDGVNLVILATHTLKIKEPLRFEALSKIAASLDIPVIDQADYILRQGSRLMDAQWKHDGHWNVAGHRWAAEALYEYIKEHPAICDRQSDPLPDCHRK